MDNHDTQATLRYHDGTKHPGGYLLNPWHDYDPMQRPLLFKLYQDVESIPLPLDKTAIGVPALEAISRTTPSESGASGASLPDLNVLARILHFSAGITKRLRYPLVGEIPFRAAACTGALYHIELYVVCGDLPGLAAGVYHFDPQGMALDLLRRGDYRSVLVEATASEPSVAKAPVMIVYTDYFWRNAVKYQAREYRHAFWDSGTIVANTLAMAAAHGVPAHLVAGFVDEMVNRLLGLDTRREAALALLSVGHAPGGTRGGLRPVSPLDLKTLPVSRHELEFPAILEMHEASALKSAEEVAAWRGGALADDQRPATHLSGAGDDRRLPTDDREALIPLPVVATGAMPEDALEEVITRRGSTRDFAREAISFEQLAIVLRSAMELLSADFLEDGRSSLNHLYLIANAVDGLEPGAYIYHPELQALGQLKKGSFRGEAGHLGLGQALAADASADLFFLSDLGPVLQRFGNRGYRAAQLEASIRAGRVYLASYAQHLGASGLTFYDDEVTAFFSPHAAGKSVMFMVLVGRRAKRGGES